MNKISFFFLRLPIAISLLGHSLVRLPKLQAFNEWMVATMKPSILPPTFLSVWGYTLPFVELILGILLLIGFQLKWSIYASLSLMAILIFGSSLIENWEAVQAQLVHAVYLGGLLFTIEINFSKVLNVGKN